jgi:hypothetical protein
VALEVGWRRGGGRDKVTGAAAAAMVVWWCRPVKADRNRGLCTARESEEDEPTASKPRRPWLVPWWA